MSNATPRARTTSDDVPVLPVDVPVTMPELPPRLVITTAEQFKAISEPTRSRILGIIQNQPATAKQIAGRLHIAPGAAGHHLQVLEAAGMAQIVAKRLVRGIVAKYYARTARIFAYDMPPDITGGVSTSVEIMRSATNELAEAIAEGSETEGSETEGSETKGCGTLSFPHARLSPERARIYTERLYAIFEDLIHESPDPAGDVYGVVVAMFRSPNYMQSDPPAAWAGQMTDETTNTEVKGDEP